MKKWDAEYKRAYKILWRALHPDQGYGRHYVKITPPTEKEFEKVVLERTERLNKSYRDRAHKLWWSNPEWRKKKNALRKLWTQQNPDKVDLQLAKRYFRRFGVNSPSDILVRLKAANMKTTRCLQSKKMIPS